MKKCYQCLDTGVVLHNSNNGLKRIYPCSCQKGRSTPQQAQQRLMDKRKKLGID